MNPDVVVLGGGFAGLRAAVQLADAGLKVLVLEGRASLGGRARSFTDPATGEVVDNGQHLFLYGYRETIRFLKRLGTEDRLFFQDRLRVVFVRPGRQRSVLRCPPLPSPWHLVVGAAGLAGLSLRDKLGLSRVSQEVSGLADGNGARFSALDRETAEDWLIRLGQSERIRAHFWDPLVVATLNESPARASALGLAAVLKVLLFSPWREARLGMATVGLSDLYASSARRIIEEKGGSVLLNRPVDRLETEGLQVTAARTADGELWGAEDFVSALPPSALGRILPEKLRAEDPSFRPLGRFSTSPIISINLWFDRTITKDLFIGFVGTRMVQWLFNKEAILARVGTEARCVSLIVSAAKEIVDLPKERIVEMAVEDLRTCLAGAEQARLLRSQVVRERDATVSLGVGMEEIRPGARTSLSNLFLAGDWTRTGLPATIESAVASGRMAADALLKEKSRRILESRTQRACHCPIK